MVCHWKDTKDSPEHAKRLHSVSEISQIKEIAVTNLFITNSLGSTSKITIPEWPCGINQTRGLVVITHIIKLT